MMECSSDAQCFSNHNDFAGNLIKDFDTMVRHATIVISIASTIIEVKKYQKVKEFHMLARIGCYCKVIDL